VRRETSFVISVVCAVATTWMGDPLVEYIRWNISYAIGDYQFYAFITLPSIVALSIYLITQGGFPRPLTQCRKCRIVLKGLTSTRCPDCDEQI